MLCRALIAAIAATAILAGSAGAETINVRPGKNAIQKAVNRADDGDRLLVRRGVYREDVVVDKRLRIVGRKGKLPVIDGQCTTDRTIDVVADRVTLRRLKVKGARQLPGDGYTVNLIGVDSGTLKRLVLEQSCDAFPAYYGVNVFDTGPLEISNVTTSGGFVDAGIYVGSIGDLGGRRFLIEGNEAFGNNVGILIEDSVPEANIVARDNITRDNDLNGLSDPAGILIRRADGGRYVGNRANGNGDYGIHILDEGGAPADNVLVDNRANGNGVADFLDQGTGTCGAGNTFPLPPC
jgi:parallel beta-helix repeat protein